MSELRVDDIRPDELMGRKQRHLEADQRWLRDRKNKFVEVPCVACGGEDLAHAFTKLGFEYDRCQGCGTLQMNPRAPAALLNEFYERSENYAFWNEHIFPASEETRREQIFAPRVTRLLELCRSLAVDDGTLLEVGAGFGTFATLAAEQGRFDRVLALEPTPSLAASCRERGLDTIEAPFEANRLEGASVDVIAAFEVLEHLFSPADFIAESRRLLRPRGLLVISVPNIAGFDTLSLGKDANAIDHEHLNYFNPTSLSGLLERIGFIVEEALTPGRLDVDLVRRALEEGDRHDVGRFVEHVVRERPDTHEAFQDFLAANQLSSHLWVVGRAPA